MGEARMRGSDQSGRFPLDEELREMYRGIKADLQGPVGQFVDWYVWDLASSTADTLYDVSSSVSGGRMWKPPVRIPVVGATIAQGEYAGSQHGFYTTDNMRFTFNAEEIYRAIPDLTTQADVHYKDRFIYRAELFTVTRLWPKGHIQGMFATVTVEANQVKPDEAINDPQFVYIAQGNPAVQNALESHSQGYPEAPLPTQTEYNR